MLKHKPQQLVIALTILVGALLFVPATVSAVGVTCPDGYTVANAPQGEQQAICADHQTGTSEKDSVEGSTRSPGCYLDASKSTCPAGLDPAKCYGATSLTSPPEYTEIPCSTSTSNGNLSADCKDTKLNKDNCGIISYLVTLINVLSGLVGIVIVIMITVGGIQYSTARDNPQAAVAAKTRITNAVMALVFFLFIYAFLQYIVPGGVL